MYSTLIISNFRFNGDLFLCEVSDVDILLRVNPFRYLPRYYYLHLLGICCIVLSFPKSWRANAYVFGREVPKIDCSIN